MAVVIGDGAEIEAEKERVGGQESDVGLQRAADMDWNWLAADYGRIRDLIADRTDPVLFALSYDYVGDLSETVALMWPRPARLFRITLVAPEIRGTLTGTGDPVVR